MFPASDKFPVPGAYSVRIGVSTLSKEMRIVNEDGDILRMNGMFSGWSTRSERDTYSDVVFVSAIDGTPPLCDVFPIAGVYECKQFGDSFIRHVHPDGRATNEHGSHRADREDIDMSTYDGGVKYVGPLPPAFDQRPVVEPKVEPKATDHPKFWLVWSPSGVYPPKFRHSTYGDAMTEAERLAKEKPGCRFYVLEASDFVENAGVKWTKLDEGEVPF